MYGPAGKIPAFILRHKVCFYNCRERKVDNATGV
jgi:hypothetical protein